MPSLALLSYVISLSVLSFFLFRFKDFAGQTWVQHVVDESKQGLYLTSSSDEDNDDKNKLPQPPYVGWSSMDYGGARWLKCLGPTEDEEIAATTGSTTELDEEAPEDDVPRSSYDEQNVFAKVGRRRRLDNVCLLSMTTDFFVWVAVVAGW